MVFGTVAACSQTGVLTPMLTNLCKKDVLYIHTYFQVTLVWSRVPLCQPVQLQMRGGNIDNRFATEAYGWLPIET